MALLIGIGKHLRHAYRTKPLRPTANEKYVMARNTKYMIAVHERFKTLRSPLIFSSSIEGSACRIFRVAPLQYVVEVHVLRYVFTTYFDVFTT